MNILTQNNQQTMTSQQIAELVGSRHDKVKQSIERLAADNQHRKAVIALPPVGVVQLLNSNRAYDVDVYVFSGEQGKRDSIIVVAQLSSGFTAALVDRWAELEQKASQSVVALPHDYISALEELLITKKGEQLAQEQLAIAAPKAAALDTLSHAKGSLGVRETAKAVGIPEREFVRRCLDKSKPMSSRFLYRDDKGRLNAHAHRIKQGFMTQKVSSYEDRDGYDFATVQVKFTAAGVAHIAKLMQNKPVNNLRVLEAV